MNHIKNSLISSIIEKEGLFMANVLKYFKENQEILDLYTTAITRAHKEHHPEVFGVKKIYTAIQDKIQSSITDTINLDLEFTKLRKLTNNYAIPTDVCPTFVATYHMLEQADHIYEEI